MATIDTNFLQLLPLTATEAPAIARLMARYNAAGSEFTDACLVHLALREPIDTIFTLNHESFPSAASPANGRSG